MWAYAEKACVRLKYPKAHQIIDRRNSCMQSCARSEIWTVVDRGCSSELYVVFAQPEFPGTLD